MKKSFFHYLTCTKTLLFFFSEDWGVGIIVFKM